MSITPYTSSVTIEQNSEAVRAERPAMTDMVARRLIAGMLVGWLCATLNFK